jgi:hypothetical protein
MFEAETFDVCRNSLELFGAGSLVAIEELASGLWQELSAKVGEVGNGAAALYHASQLATGWFPAMTTTTAARSIKISAGGNGAAASCNRASQMAAGGFPAMTMTTALPRKCEEALSSALEHAQQEVVSGFRRRLR